MKRIRNFFEATRLTILNFQKLLWALITALNRNTATNEELLATAKATLEAAKAAQIATQYLAASDRHRREQSGQRTEFI